VRRVVGLWLLFLVASCRRGPDQSAVTIAVRADVTGFFPNPPMVDESFTNSVNGEVLEGLVRFDPEWRLTAAIAERWETPDELTYVFHLQAGLRFSDGRPLTATDVAASLLANTSRGWPTAGYLRNIESARADGPLRLVIRTRVPYPLLLYKLHWGYVLPAARLSENPVPLVGTGPYRLASWQPGKGFALERSETYRGPPPVLRKARFEVVPDPEERIARLLSGRVDVADEIPLQRTDELRKEPGIRVFSGPSLRVLFLTLRVTEPPFSDPRVREAVDLAIDRQELVARAYDGKTVTATQLVPPSIVGYNPSIPAARIDLTRSRALLAEAGYPSGLDVRLDGTHNRYVNDRRILAELARQLARVGIRVTVNALDKASFFPLVDSGRSRFHLVGWSCGSGEAGEALEALVASPGAGLGTANSAGFRDPVLDGLLEESDRALDPARRIEALQRALARVADQRPVLPLLVQSEALAVSRRVDWSPGIGFGIRVEEMRPSRR